MAVLLLGALLLWTARPAQAQYTDAGDRVQQDVQEQLAAASVGDSVEVMLKGGGVRPTGVIVEQDERILKLRKPSGSRQTIRRSLIYAVTPLDEETQARLREVRDALTNRADPNQARLIFAPTARTYRPGQIYLAGYEIVLPYVGVGIGQLMDLRVGFSALPTTIQIGSAGAKIGLVQTERFNVAVGALGVATSNVITSDAGTDEYGGAIYALTTIGRPRAALTLGGGYVATGGAIEEESFLMVGGEVRLPNSRLKLLTENYLLVGSNEAGENSKSLFGGAPFSGDVSGIGSAAVRLIGRRASVDLGVATSNRWWDKSFPVLPIVTASYSINGP